MGQVLLPENIPLLVKGSSVGFVFAATHQGKPTRINIGGQQYTLSSSISIDITTTGVNGIDTGSVGPLELRYVYAIVHQTSFTVALVASLNGPATGPTMPSGYGTAYRLVGAFYSNGSSLTGSPVNITGPIETEWFGMAASTASNVRTSTGLTMGGTSSAPGFGTVAWNTTSMRRVGDTIWIRHAYAHTTAGTLGSGTYYWALPTSMTIDGSKISTFGNTSRATIGYAQMEDATGKVYEGTAEVLDTASFTLNVGNEVSTPTRPGSTTYGMTASSQRYGFVVSFPIQGWTTTLV